MKTLHLTNAWHPTSGGVSTFYRALIAAAEKNRHSACLVVPSDSTRVERVNPHARIHHIRSPRVPGNRQYRILLPHHFLIPGASGHSILREERPDLVEVCDKYSLHYVGALLRRGWIPGIDHRPAVIGLSCERLDVSVRAYVTDSAAARTLARWYMKWLYFPFFDHHITVSEHTSRELQEASRGHWSAEESGFARWGLTARCFLPSGEAPKSAIC